MKHRLKKAYRLLVMCGLDPLKTLRFIRGLPDYFRDLRALKRQQAAVAEPFPLAGLHPCITDRFSESGSARGHYFHQDLLVARRIHENNPEVHADVGSRVDGFVAHVASFRPIVVMDVRAQTNRIPNIRFLQADLMAPVRADLVEFCDSLSCLHALEHFGLGRYGDPIRHDGHRAGLENLRRMLKRNGKLYLSVPIGPQRIEFNAHRVFSVIYLMGLLENKFRIDRFSYVDDRGDLHENVALTEENARNSLGCSYGCGIFETTKL